MKRQEILEKLLSTELNQSKTGKLVEVINVLQLLKFNNKEFLIEAYNSILKRDPDLEGLQENLRLMKRGKSKEYILYCIATSQEAQSASHKLTGMNKLHFLMKLSLQKRTLIQRFTLSLLRIVFILLPV